jgi:hypothetical protein
MRNGRMVKTLLHQHLLATKVPETILGTIVVLPVDKVKDVRRNANGKSVKMFFFGYEVLFYTI